MYVYIKDEKIEAITPNQLPPRDGITELDIPDEDVELTNNLQYLVYENGTVERREHTQEEFTDLTIQKRSAPEGYKTRRKLSYPLLEEQLDKLFHDIESGTLNQSGEFFNAIKEIKDANPKPE